MILYGSCARGGFKDYSDVDIALLILKAAGRIPQNRIRDQIVMIC